MKSRTARETVVLIVQDEPMIRMAAMLLVKGLGYRAIEAKDADEAILMLEAHSEITIVFTDIQMAGSMDGLALTLAADRWPPLRFIIVSGGLSSKVAEMPVGAIFLSKPYADSSIAT